MSRPRVREITLDDVRAALAGADLRYAGARQMAERFGISQNTLRNRMKECGTTWQRELVAEKFRRFESATAAGEIKHGYEYARLCGFWEPLSFYRAFRDWYGMGFNQWRRQQRAAA